ncbi:MAG TPA: GNAT family N-acetyltransferase [Anaerolineales bacterium]|nr:GNAT family N-acetyltransferase [Anaerolineales bacterium]
MKRYSVRPARLSDLEAVHAIIATQNTIDYGNALRTLADVQKTWQSLNLDNDTCAAFADGQMAGYAELLDNDSPFIYLADRHNVDLAFQLLTILEKMAADRKKSSVNLFTKISENNNTLLQLYASNGYKSNLSFQIMELEMQEYPPAPQWPDGIRVRTFIKGLDEKVTYQTDEEASRDKGYHDPLGYEDWVKRMRMNGESFDPSLWFLAGAGDEVAGVVLNFFAKESSTGWVDHLSVRTSWRNQGIGRALLLHSLAEFYRRNIHKIKLSVDSKSLTNAPRLYESVGMKTVQQYHIYRKEI